MPEFLTLEDILELHTGQIRNYGGSEGLRSSELLQSAIAQPRVTFGGQFLHNNIFHMAAAYLFHLVQNHPFVDGNKRIGLEAALVFLELNVKRTMSNSLNLFSELLRGRSTRHRFVSSSGLTPLLPDQK
ncbi:MAG: type II toxin-antitoxin system death-on-curing family toxin [Planctomyces sp.]